MARFEGLLQNRCTLTVVMLTVMAVLVAYKTVQTKPFQTDTHGVVSLQSLKLAQDLTRAEPPEPGDRDQHSYTSGAGYPIVIAALASFDHKLKSALHCHQQQVTCDPGAFKSLFALQYVFALLSLVAIFLLAWVLSRSWSVALLTLIFAFVAGSFGGLAGLLSPLIWLQTLMFFFLLFLALAATRDDVKWTLAAGVTLGCGALFSPQLLVVGIVSTVSVWLIGKGRHLNLRHPLAHAGALAIGTLSVATAVAVFLHAADLKAVMWQQLIHNTSERLTESNDLLSYLITTPGIFLRGLWVGTPILTLLGLIHLPSLLKFSREDARLGPTLLVAIPILSLVLVNALLTANRPAYNVGLVFLLCYATAYLVGRTEIRRKFWEDKERSAMTVS